MREALGGDRRLWLIMRASMASFIWEPAYPWFCFSARNCRRICRARSRVFHLEPSRGSLV